MPIRNGRLYTDKTKTPSVGITLHEIAKCIGVGSLDLQTLCEHPKVNMWSRKKPIGKGDRDLDYVGEWWKSPDGSCSINPPKRVSTFYTLLGLYDGKHNGWTRMIPPKGRQLDFDGYFHYAQPPVKEMDSQEYYFNIDGPIDVSIAYNPDDVDETGSGSIKMTDLIIDNMPLSDWYIGIAVYSEDGSLCKGYVATQQGENVETIHYPSDELIVGQTYLLVPFYSKVKLEFNSGDSTEESLMSIPIVQPVKFRYRDVTELLTIIPDIIWAEDKKSFTLDVKVVNNGVTFRNVEIGTARVMAVRSGFQSSDDYWTANIDAELDYEVDLGLSNVDIPVTGLAVSKTVNVRENFNDYTYVLLVRLISMKRNFDYGPEEIASEVEPS